MLLDNIIALLISDHPYEEGICQTKGFIDAWIRSMPFMERKNVRRLVVQSIPKTEINLHLHWEMERKRDNDAVIHYLTFRIFKIIFIITDDYLLYEVIIDLD